MTTVSLIPPDDLVVVGLGTCFAGQPTDVPVEMAGVATDPRREPAMQELALAIAAIDHARASELRAEIADMEPGYGLLAQGWKLATPPKAAAADTATPPAAAAAARPRTPRSNS